jgi:hypothetical protein
MPNNVVRSMVLICAMYAIGVPILSYTYGSYIFLYPYIIVSIYARNHNLYIFIYLCVYIYIIIIYVLKNISGQYICIYYDREAAYNNI